MLRCLISRVARVHAFGGKAQEEIFAHFEAGPLQHRQHQLVGGPRICGRFQDHQLAGAEVLGGLLAGRHDVAHVGIFGLAQRSGDRDVDGIQIGDHREIRGGVEFSGFHQRAQSVAGYVLHIGFARVQPRDLRFLNVDARDRKAGFGELDGQRQTHITEADDTDARGPGLDFFFQDLLRGRNCRLHRSCNYSSAPSNTGSSARPVSGLTPSRSRYRGSSSRSGSRFPMAARSVSFRCG